MCGACFYNAGNSGTTPPAFAGGPRVRIIGSVCTGHYQFAVSVFVWRLIWNHTVFGSVSGSVLGGFCNLLGVFSVHFNRRGGVACFGVMLVVFGCFSLRRYIGICVCICSNGFGFGTGFGII
jgi:hypothetical protein